MVYQNPVDMIKKNSLIVVLVFSSFLQAEMINLRCSTQDSDRDFSFDLLLGTTTQRAIQSSRKGQLQMDLKVTEEYFEIGQFTEESKTKIIPIIKINKDTMEVEYAKYMELVEQILCIKI